MSESEPIALLPSSGLGIYEISNGLYQSGIPETSEDWDTVWGLVDVVVSLGSLTHMGGPAPASAVLDVPEGKIEIAWNIPDGPVPDESFLLQLAETVAVWVSNKHAVLIHCGAGINRSGLLSALVVRRLTGESGRICAEHVRQHKPGSLINGDFNAYLNSLPELEPEEFPELGENEEDEQPKLSAGPTDTGDPGTDC